MIPTFNATDLKKQIIDQRASGIVFLPSKFITINVPVNILINESLSNTMYGPFRLTLNSMLKDLRVKYPLAYYEDIGSSQFGPIGDEEILEQSGYEFFIPVTFDLTPSTIAELTHVLSYEGAKEYLLLKALGPPDAANPRISIWYPVSYGEINITYDELYTNDWTKTYEERPYSDLITNALLSSGSANKQKRGLIVQQPWLDMILSGEKTMDLRSFTTSIRGEVAILHDGKIWGYVNLYDVLGPMTKREINQHYNQHRVDSHLIRNYEYGWLFKNLRTLQRPRKYDHPQGAQVWVKL